MSTDLARNASPASGVDRQLPPSPLIDAGIPGSGTLVAGTSRGPIGAQPGRDLRPSRWRRSRPSNQRMTIALADPVTSRSRPLIVESWMRSAASGIDADTALAPVSADVDDIIEYRNAHPLSRVYPLLYDVLGGAAEDCNAVLALGDADGKLLWVCGRPSTLRKAEKINFIEGSLWDERAAGTNAPGTALRLDTAVQIRTGEHYAHKVRNWSCVAAPIHDPETQAVLGVVDITGSAAVSSPQTLAMVRAAARMAEAELGRIAAVRRLPESGLWVPTGTQCLRINALGRPDCLVDDGNRTYQLSERHSDILTVLASNPDGVSGDQLAIDVYPDDVRASTMRAEMTRLRALLGEQALRSRPYRLRVPVECDWLAVQAELAKGNIRGAMQRYRGPLLPASEAPGVIERRDQLHHQLRAALIASGDVNLMVTWTRSRWGAEDLQMWQHQARALPPSSPLRPLVVAEIRRLDARFR